MLAVSPLRSAKDERGGQMEDFSAEENGFLDFSSGSLLDSIDFDDLFVGISDGDLLPELEMDPEILADFAVSDGGDDSLSISNGPTATSSQDDKVSALASDLCSGSSSLIQGEEIVNQREVEAATAAAPPPPPPPREGREKGRKSSANSKNPLGKRKVKVDWTPELHRRFVQAVEQLGVDKAVPSRILELMGIDCLTRHNIASHLQKYRSHRKHLLAREAEAASWSQRRQMYGAAAVPGGAGKRDANPWIAPTMGFPPVQPMPPPFRPLHVWGHPSVDQSFMHVWPKQLSRSPPTPHAWPPPPAPLPLPPQPSPDPSSYWHSHRQNVPTPGTPCFPSHFPPTMFYPPRVPIMPAAPALFPAPPAGQTLPQPPSDVHPSKESIDAAIEDVLSKPWLPLPLGLKPPSIDSVMSELQLQGISKIPPTCA